jgi:hypothetical protein
MTRLTAYAVYLMAALYVALSAYVLFGGWRRKSERPRVRLTWFLILPIAIFITLWFSGRWIWTVFYWLFVFGDAGPYEEYAMFTSGIVALLISATVFTRLALGRIHRRYLRIISWGAAASAALIVTVLTHEFTHRIYGWTARGAAENYLAKTRVDERHPFVSPGAARRIVEESAPIDDPQKPIKRFVLYYGNSPIRYVHVAPYGWFWWTLSASGPTDPFFDVDSAVRHWESDPGEATERLNALIEKYPNSGTSRWAEKTLENLKQHGSKGTPRLQSEMLKRLQEEAKRRRAQANKQE